VYDDHTRPQSPCLSITLLRVTSKLVAMPRVVCHASLQSVQTHSFVSGGACSWSRCGHHTPGFKLMHHSMLCVHCILTGLVLKLCIRWYVCSCQELQRPSCLGCVRKLKLSSAYNTAGAGGKCTACALRQCTVQCSLEGDVMCLGAKHLCSQKPLSLTHCSWATQGWPTPRQSVTKAQFGTRSRKDPDRNVRMTSHVYNVTPPP
jgi:hypothetical protein